MNPIAGVGRSALDFVRETGAMASFFAQAAVRFPSVFGRFGLYLKQAEHVGFNSLPIVLLTAFFTGGVLALQSYHGLGNNAFANTQLGKLVALSMLRELGPVLASLMVAGRVGAAMAAELGTMKVTEQIDALVTLATNPIKYLVVPRLLACMTMVPLLVILANVTGIFGGYMVSTEILNISGNQYMRAVMDSITGTDITLGLVKAVVFGLIVGLMGCYHGYATRGGAAGVGRATTIAVVHASVLILITDYFITAWFV